jgi:transposase
MPDMANLSLWSERVSAWRQSGLSARAFARGKGYSASSLYYWRRRVAEEREARERRGDRAIRLARVIPTRLSDAGDAAARATASPLILEFAGARLIVEPGFDRTSLAAVLDALDRHSRRGEP